MTTTCSDRTNTTKISDMPFVHPRCILPPCEWTNFVKTATAMRDFASSCIPKTNFAGVDVCLFDLCTCLDYGFDMDICLAHALQASIMFVPSAHECHLMQQLIPKIYIKELINEEQFEEQQNLRETMLRIEEAVHQREVEK